MGDSCAQLSKGEGTATICSTEDSDILDFLGCFWLGWFGLGVSCFLVGRLGNLN